MLMLELSHQSHQLACRTSQPSSSRDQKPAASPTQDMDSLLSTIQGQYFSAVASTLSRVIVLSSGGAVGPSRREKVSPTHSNDPHLQQPKPAFEPQAHQERQQQQQQQNHNQASRRRALNKQHHERQNSGPASQPTTPLDLSKRRLSDESEPPTSSSEHADSSSAAPNTSPLLFPLNLVTKSEVASVAGVISSSGLIASSTVSPASSGSPTSSLSSSSSISSSGPQSSEFEGARSRTVGAVDERPKTQAKRQQRRRPTKKLKGAKSHMCEHCGRSFSRSDMLTRHSRLHSGLKPYQCAKCHQVFSRSDHLSTHERTHTGEKPYQCRFCSYSACRRDMITRHMRTHTIGATASAGPGSPASLDIQMKLEASQSSDLTQASRRAPRTRRRQANEPPASSLEHKFFQHSETGPTQQLVQTPIEHFHRPYIGTD